MALFVPGILRNVLLRHLSINNNIENEYLKNSIFKYSILINLISTILPLLFLNIYNFKLLIFFGESFEGLELLIFPISVMTLIASISNPYYQIYISNLLNWRLFFIRLIKDGVSFLLILFALMVYNYQSIDVLIYIIYIASFCSFLQLGFMYFDTLDKNK